MPAPLIWPSTHPAAGGVVLRRFEPADLPLVAELATDPYLPQIGSIPVTFTEAEGRAWIERQHARTTEGAGFSFAIADATTARAVGAIGLWTRSIAEGRATAGYAVSPMRRRRGYASDALRALTAFAWTLPQVHRIELYIEGWNTGSVRAAENAGYRLEGVLRSHQEIGGARRDMHLYATTRTEHDPPPG